jgi:hypothetical protein
MKLLSSAHMERIFHDFLLFRTSEIGSHMEAERTRISCDLQPLILETEANDIPLALEWAKV